MTEAEWPSGTDPDSMLKLFCEAPPWRKVRLFACACLRSIWDLIPEGKCRSAVEIAQRFAEGESPACEFEETAIWMENAFNESLQGSEHFLTRVDYLATAAVRGFFRWIAHESMGLHAAHYSRKARARVTWRKMVGSGDPESLEQAKLAMDATEREVASLPV